MKLWIRIVPRVLLLAGTSLAVQQAVKRSTYVDANYGFSVEVPRFPAAGSTTPGTIAVFTGPAVDGFAPNVNVNVQAMTTTLRDYRAISNRAIQQTKVKVNSDRDVKVSGRDAIEMDYEGILGGSRMLRYLSLSVIDKDRVIQITCAAKPEIFPVVEAEFRACIQSIKLD